MDVELTRDDVVGTYAGLRPLIAPSDGSTVKASREHRVTVESNGVVRIGGGKYTTYRLMARDVIDTVLGPAEAKKRRSDTAERRLVGAADTDALARIAGELSTIPAVRDIGPETAARLVARHGTEATARRRAGRRTRPAAPAGPRSILPRSRGGVGRPPRTGALARRRPGAPDPAGPGAARPWRVDRPAGRADPRRRARLGRSRASGSRSRLVSRRRRGASIRSRRRGRRDRPPARCRPPLD